ncbi:hypothetical protein V6Z11_D07G216600 [Gossypium hirsutum]
MHHTVWGLVLLSSMTKERCLYFKRIMARSKAKVWKFPTGVVNEGEDICMAAIREVKEETGIDTEFVEILAFRQSHKSFFKKSDLFFVCMLRPLSFDIQKQDTEIEAAQWMSINEYAAQPFIQKYDGFRSVANVCLAKLEKDYAGFPGFRQPQLLGKLVTYTSTAEI